MSERVGRVARIWRVNRGVLVRLALAIACFILSALAFRTALVRLFGAMLAWFAAALTFGLGSLLLLSVAWGAIRAWLARRRERRQRAA